MEILQNITQPGKKYRTRFLISGDDKLFTLQVEDIAYFYSENKVTFAVTKQNREFIIDLSLDKLMEQLDPDVFFRSNRQTVVSINAIVKVESYFLGKAILHVKPPFKDKIIVSRDKNSSFKTLAKLLNFSRVNSACLNIHIPNQLLFHSVRLIRKAPIPLRTRAFPNYKNQKKRCVRDSNP